MAKLPFTKLSLKNNNEIKTINYNNQIIEVKQYLPINTKLELISNVINYSMDNNNFSNPVKEHLFLHLEIVVNYTNITFTDKQKEDPCKLYDLLKGNDILDLIIQNIPENEYNDLRIDTGLCSKAIYDYRNSVMGILEAVSTDYSNLNLNATEIQKKLADPENMTLLKEVLTKLG